MNTWPSIEDTVWGDLGGMALTGGVGFKSHTVCQIKIALTLFPATQLEMWALSFLLQVPWQLYLLSCCLSQYGLKSSYNKLK